jgi:hypothetical protein
MDNSGRFLLGLGLRLEPRRGNSKARGHFVRAEPSVFLPACRVLPQRAALARLRRPEFTLSSAVPELGLPRRGSHPCRTDPTEMVAAPAEAGPRESRA